MNRIHTRYFVAGLPAAALLFVAPADVQAAPLAVDGAPPQPSAQQLASGTYRSEPLREAQAGRSQGPGGLAIPDGPPTAVTAAPLAAAYCQINVNGSNKATETDYLPHVIQCENGGANLQALKAQAIAARSVAYYAMAENGKICDGQGCQVYSCGSNPLPIHIQAVQETAGQYLSFNNTQKGQVLTYAFFVSGDNDQTANCHGVSPNANTENYVTYNEGKKWTDVIETSLGFKYKTPANYGYGQNRGCMSQWSARCLENKKGYDYKKIIRYFYGEDIEITQAQGPCVGKIDFAAKYAGQSFPPASQPAVMLTEGETLEAWIDLTNVGDQTWTANTKLAPTPRDKTSPLASASWLSPTRITGPDQDTKPDAVGRFSFQLTGGAPGEYFQTFGLVEEGVTWFSDAPKGGGPPDDQLEVRILVVPAPPDPSTTSSGETGSDSTSDGEATGGTEGTGGTGGTDATGMTSMTSMTGMTGVTGGTGETGGGPGESGDPSGTPTTGAGSSGSSGYETDWPGKDSDGSPPAGDDSDSGCGCHGGAGSDAPVWLLTPLLLLLRRRSRRA